MLTAEHVKWIALFFNFVFLDESLSNQAAHAAITTLKVRPKHSPHENESAFRSRVVEVCRNQWAAKKKSRHAASHTQIDWRVPANVDLSTWVRFQKTASEEETLALIFSQVLGFSDLEIARGLKVSEGTVRFRAARAVRALGATNQARI